MSRHKSLIKKIIYFLLPMALPSPAMAEENVLTVPINVSFRQIADFLQGEIDAGMNALIRRENCSEVGTSADNRPPKAQYRCGELPVGSIVDRRTKHLMTIQIGTFNGKKGSVRYKIRGKRADLHIEREQSGDRIEISLLNSQKEETYRTGETLGDDTFFLFNPVGGKLRNRVCLATPEIKAFVEPAVLHGNLAKEMPWPLPDLHSSVRIDLDLGWSKLGSAALCSDLETTIDAEGLPVIDMVRLIPPKRIDVVQKGLKVKASASVGGFWGFISPILRAFGYDLERIVAKAVQKEVMLAAKKELKIRSEDIRNGSWFAKYLDGIHLNDISEKLSAKVRDRLKNSGWGLAPVENALQAACLAAILPQKLPKEAEAELLKLCLRSPTVRLKPFLNSEEHRQRGCYSHFISSKDIASSTPRWWEADCEIRNRVSISVYRPLNPLYRCLIGAWNAQHNPLHECATEISGLIADFEAGRYDDLVKMTKNRKARRPARRELLTLRSESARRLGVPLPSAENLEKLWRTL